MFNIWFRVKVRKLDYTSSRILYIKVIGVTYIIIDYHAEMRNGFKTSYIKFDSSYLPPKWIHNNLCFLLPKFQFSELYIIINNSSFSATQLDL